MTLRRAIPLAGLIALALVATACDRRAAPVATPTTTAVLPTAPTAAVRTATLAPAPSPTPSSAPATATAQVAPAATPRPSPPPPPPAPTATAVPTASPAPTATPVETPRVEPTPGPPTATATPPAPTPTPTPGQVVAQVAGAFGVPVRLATGVEADFPDGRSLALLAVTGDSRCPADVQCVWAGEATLSFAWAAPGQVQRVSLVAAPATGATDLGGDHRLRLLELAPAPRAARPIAPTEYVATVVVETAGAPPSGLFGSVTVGPSCAVQRESDPCPDRPLAATLVIRNPAGAEVARTLSDAAGFYAVALPPGRYTVVPFTPGGGTLPRGIPRDVVVPAGEWIAADISYDSGIR